MPHLAIKKRKQSSAILFLSLYIHFPCVNHPLSRDYSYIHIKPYFCKLFQQHKGTGALGATTETLFLIFHVLETMRVIP